MRPHGVAPAAPASAPAPPRPCTHAGLPRAQVPGDQTGRVAIGFWRVECPSAQAARQHGTGRHVEPRGSSAGVGHVVCGRFDGAQAVQPPACGGRDGRPRRHPHLPRRAEACAASALRRGRRHAKAGRNGEKADRSRAQGARGGVGLGGLRRFCGRAAWGDKR
eukprot:scaffold4272_cov129-Isochrysis_galbana.AAC.5